MVGANQSTFELRPFKLERKGTSSEADLFCLESNLNVAAKYIRSFKVGRVGDEELFDVMHFKLAQAKRSDSPEEPGVTGSSKFFPTHHTLCSVEWLQGNLWQLSASASTFAVHLSGSS